MSSHCVDPKTLQPGACMQPLTLSDALTAAYKAGWRGFDLIRIVATAQAESHLIPNAVNDQTGAYGLTQINPKGADALHPPMSSAGLDPQNNFVLAGKLWQSQSWGAWSETQAQAATYFSAVIAVADITPLTKSWRDGYNPTAGAVGSLGNWVWNNLPGSQLPGAVGGAVGDAVTNALTGFQGAILGFLSRVMWVVIGLVGVVLAVWLMTKDRKPLVVQSPARSSGGAPSAEEAMEESG